jgi:O-antigen biosynthesis protein
MKAKKPSLRDLFAAHTGKVSDKWDIYISEYDRLFQPYRDQPVRLLEIGIQNGGSLEVWNKYFAKAKRIIGSDIDPKCEQLTFDDPKIAVVVADANTNDAERRILTESDGFDLIIDDGSHQSGDIVRSFARYFKHVADGGLYIAEDLHCSYWQDFEGGIFQPYSSIAFFKQLTDAINHEHWGIAKTRCEVLVDFETHYQAKFDEDSLAEIHSIEFINSICVVKKKRAQSNVLGTRNISGALAVVDSAPIGLAHSSNLPPSQAHNPWSNMSDLAKNTNTGKSEGVANSKDAYFEKYYATQQRLNAQLEKQIEREREFAVQVNKLLQANQMLNSRQSNMFDGNQKILINLLERAQEELESYEKTTQDQEYLLPIRNKNNG